MVWGEELGWGYGILEALLEEELDGSSSKRKWTQTFLKSSLKLKKRINVVYWL